MKSPVRPGAGLIRRHQLGLIFSLCLLSASSIAQTDPAKIRIAVATNFKPTLDLLLTEFERAQTADHSTTHGPYLTIDHSNMITLMEFAVVLLEMASIHCEMEITPLWLKEANLKRMKKQNSEW